MTFEIRQGDLFDPNMGFQGLAQGVNCQGIMGAGIAVPFREKFPLMYEEYKELCATKKEFIPGTVQWSNADSISNDLDMKEALPEVFNMFTQVQPGANASYDLVAQSAHNLDETIKTILKSAAVMAYAITDRHVSGPELLDAMPFGFTVGLPWIGCGIGGLERHNVGHILKTILDPSAVHYVLVEQP